MRSLRPIFAFLAIAAIVAACGSPAASGGGPTATTPPEVTQPPATNGGGGGGGGGGGANGSVTYKISGDYAASGELPYVPVVSSFSNGGWTATFANEDAEQLIQINSVGGTLVIAYGDGKVAIVGTGASGCTINVTRNDSSGLAGDFRCPGVTGVNAATTASITVDFSGAFDGHP
jgi:hypothetical protein